MRKYIVLHRDGKALQVNAATRSVEHWDGTKIEVVEAESPEEAMDQLGLDPITEEG